MSTMRLAAVSVNWQQLLRLGAAVAILAGLAVGSRIFVRPDACASGTDVANATNAAGSLTECAFRCSESGSCAALLMGRSGCSLINSEQYYETWFGQGAECPAGLFKKETDVSPLSFVSCSQSSLTFNLPCTKAIDGNTNQKFSAYSCIHTNSTTHTWWRASLPKRAFVERVALFNRLDCCSETLNNFTISLDGFVFASYYENGSFSAKNFSCGRVGQTVQVDKYDGGNALILCEVIGYGAQFP